MTQNTPQSQIQFLKESSNEVSSSTTQSIFDSISEKTGSMFSYLKSKTPLLTTAETSQAILPNLEQIKEETFRELQLKSQEISCKEIKKSQLNGTTIISVVENPKVMDKGIFDNYVSYDIKTEQLKWYVTRRYSDFIWLRNVLMAQFPGEIIPQLPKKKMGNRRFEGDFIKKRMQSLQDFIDEINKNELLKSSETLNIFLSCSDRVLFDFNMKQITPTVVTISSVAATSSMTGKNQVIDFDNDNYIKNNYYYMNINNCIKLQEESLSKLTTSLKEYYNNMANAMLNLKEVESNLSTLCLIYSKTALSPTIGNAYQQFRIFTDNWKSILIHQTCIVKKKMHLFFKMANNYSQSFSELIAKQEELKNEYFNKKTKLMLKKETLWKTQDLTKYDLNPYEDSDKYKISQDKVYAMQKMCYKETIELTDVGNLLGYYYFKNGENFWNMIHSLEKSFVQNMHEFSSLFEPTLTDAINVWSTFTSNI